jgi:hypothetical protein
VSLRLRSHGGSAMRYSALGLPSGLTIDRRTGVISGRPRRIGTALVTASATDRRAAVARASLMWVVGGAPSLRAAVRGAHLVLSIVHGRGAPAVARVAISGSDHLRFGPVRVTGPGRERLPHSTTLAGGVLVLELTAAANGFRISVGQVDAPGLVRVRITDTLGHTTRVTAAF